MDFIVTDKYGQDKGYLEHCGVNFNVGQDNDFEVKIQNKLFRDDRHRKIVGSMPKIQSMED